MSTSNPTPDATPNPGAPTDPQQLAQAVADAMWARDHATHAMGMTLVSVAPGSAVIHMTVRRDMLNGHGTCHGGFMFTLADSAFAFACNSYNINAVAAACTIDFLAPAREGDVLEAHAQEQVLAGRSGVYDVTVRRQGGGIVALFRGKSARIQGDVITGLQANAAR